MFIYTKVSFNDFIDAFHRTGRWGKFTGDGLLIIYDYLERESKRKGRPIELDIIKIYEEFDRSRYALLKRDGETLEEVVEALSTITEVIGYNSFGDIIHRSY